MTKPIIQVEGLGKQYRIGLKETQATSFRQAIMGTLRSPVQYLLEMSRPPNEAETLWAIRDITFQVAPGEVVGIIGRNGAGKSTLLKILARITEPTEGRAELKGRMGSLLEVGTGFHADLTGRENVYMNGAILGMKKSEIDRKFDEIVSFAEIEKFIDTPVKRYSSGMYVRLAFAVAAHLEPEILIVDEVLAVGDAAFRAKCLGKMSDIARKGRTILFVSHSTSAIATLTDWSLVLNHGQISYIGSTDEALRLYLSEGYQEGSHWRTPELTCDPIQILEAWIKADNHLSEKDFEVQSNLHITIKYVVRALTENFVVAAMVHAADGALLLSAEDTDSFGALIERRAPGTYCSTVTLPGGWLNKGDYFVRVSCGKAGHAPLNNIEALRFSLVDLGNHVTRSHRRGYLLPNLNWAMEKVEQVIEP